MYYWKILPTKNPPFCSGLNVLAHLSSKTDVAIKSVNNINSSPPWQNGRRFADNILKCIFVKENFCIPNKISLNFASKGPIDNNSALV